MVDLQDDKLPRPHGEHREQCEANDEAGEGAEIASSEDHQAVPTTDYETEERKWLAQDSCTPPHVCQDAQRRIHASHAESRAMAGTYAMRLSRMQANPASSRPETRPCTRPYEGKGNFHPLGESRVRGRLTDKPAFLLFSASGRRQRRATAFGGRKPDIATIAKGVQALDR